MKIDKIIDPGFKKGETNGKPWTLMKVQVGDNEATIFAPAAEGDEVELTYDNKYHTYSAKKLNTKSQPKSFTADPKKLEQEFKLEVAKNQSIQRQVALKAVVDLIVADKREYGDLVVTFDDMMELLHKQWQPTKEVVVDAGDFAKINPDEPPVEVYEGLDA